MKGLDWGIYYNHYGSGNYDQKTLEARIVKLLDDEDVSNQKGIYEYLLDGKEKHLNIRAFSPKMARTAYERQQGICPKYGSTSRLKKCKPIILRRGVKAVIPHRITVKCFVRIATAEKAICK